MIFTGILAILAAVIFVVGGVFMVSKSPERREMVMNVFRRRTINRIQYSRVNILKLLIKVFPFECYYLQEALTNFQFSLSFVPVFSEFRSSFI